MIKMTDEVAEALRNNDGAPATITPFPTLSLDAFGRIRRMFDEMLPSRETLAVLFALDAAQTAASEEWSGYFVETVSAQLIWGERPTGVLLDKDAAFLLNRFDEAPTITVLALLVRVLEEAHHMPAWFPAAVRHRAALFRVPEVSDRKPRKEVSYLRLVA